MKRVIMLLLVCLILISGYGDTSEPIPIEPVEPEIDHKSFNDGYSVGFDAALEEIVYKMKSDGEIELVLPDGKKIVLVHKNE